MKKMIILCINALKSECISLASCSCFQAKDFHVNAQLWSPGKRRHIVADTLLSTQMFPRLPARATFVADANFVSGTQKMFLILFRNILCPQQCVLVYRGLRRVSTVIQIKAPFIQRAWRAPNSFKGTCMHLHANTATRKQTVRHQW